MHVFRMWIDFRGCFLELSVEKRIKEKLLRENKRKSPKQIQKTKEQEISQRRDLDL